MTKQLTGFQALQEFMFESLAMNYIHKSLYFDNKWQNCPKVICIENFW